MKFEYKCHEKACDITKEISNLQDPIPSCHGQVMKRVYQIAGVAFKGPGFYKTDNK